MIDEPLPGSTELAALRLPPEQFDCVPLNVWLPGELVADLVRHVVDGEEVPDRRREAGAALRLVVPADDAEARHAAAGVAEADVADVVVRRADQLADDDARARSVAPPHEVAWAGV